MSSDDVIIEFIPVGNVVKVTAIDTRTGKEVSIVGDPSAPKQTLTNLAVKKLRYVQNRDRAGNTGSGKRGLDA